jgi:RecJ-like exonuclease
MQVMAKGDKCVPCDGKGWLVVARKTCDDCGGTGKQP